MKLSLIKLIKLSAPCQLILPGKNGKQRWVEMSERFLPPGGKKFTVSYVTFVFTFFNTTNIFLGNIWWYNWIYGLFTIC